jgi:hypothetical protein
MWGVVRPCRGRSRPSWPKRRPAPLLGAHRDPEAKSAGSASPLSGSPRVGALVRREPQCGRTSPSAERARALAAWLSGPRPLLVLPRAAAGGSTRPAWPLPRVAGGWSGSAGRSGGRRSSRPLPSSAGEEPPENPAGGASQSRERPRVASCLRITAPPSLPIGRREKTAGKRRPRRAAATATRKPLKSLGGSLATRSAVPAALAKDGPTPRMPFVRFSVAVDPPRLLHRDSSHGYTSHPALALPRAAEAIDEETQRRISTAARMRFAEARSDENARADSKRRCDRLRKAEMRARDKGADGHRHQVEVRRAVVAMEEATDGTL